METLARAVNKKYYPQYIQNRRESDIPKLNTKRLGEYEKP